MDSPTESVNREETSPFLLKLFHKTGTFHRPDEFVSSHSLPSHTAVYAWPSVTLRELTHLLAAAAPSALPTPAIGTRVAYRLLYHDTRNNPSAPRLATQELGSVVIGDGGPGILDENAEVDMAAAALTTTAAATTTTIDEAQRKESDAAQAPTVAAAAAAAAAASAAPRSNMNMVGSEAEADKTLADVRFVVGDFLSVAILPPSTVDGSVQPVPTARTGRGYGVAGLASSGNVGAGFGGDAGMGTGRDGRYGGRALGGAMGGDRRFRGDQFAVPPMGEWRRGERLPDVPPPRGRGRRRW